MAYSNVIDHINKHSYRITNLSKSYDFLSYPETFANFQEETESFGDIVAVTIAQLIELHANKIGFVFLPKDPNKPYKELYEICDIVEEFLEISVKPEELPITTDPEVLNYHIRINRARSFLAYLKTKVNQAKRFDSKNNQGIKQSILDVFFRGVDYDKHKQ